MGSHCIGVAWAEPLCSVPSREYDDCARLVTGGDIRTPYPQPTCVDAVQVRSKWTQVIATVENNSALAATASWTRALTGARDSGSFGNISQAASIWEALETSPARSRIAKCTSRPALT